jgi:hypothetical protein
VIAQVTFGCVIGAIAFGIVRTVRGLWRTL